MMSGPFGIENDILDRLQEVVGPLATVASGAALSAQGLSLGELATPLVVVEPREAQVLDLSARADHVVEDQNWVVAVLVRHVADPERLRVDYSEVDPIIETVIAGLTGWQPPAGVREVRYQGREDMLHEPGLLEVGILFSAIYHLRQLSAT